MQRKYTQLEPKKFFIPHDQLFGRYHTNYKFSGVIREISSAANRFSSDQYSCVIEDYNNAFSSIKTNDDQILLPLIWANRGLCFLYLEKYEDAINDYKQILKYDFAKQSQYYGQSTGLFHHYYLLFTSHINIGIALYCLGKDDDAINSFLQAYSIYPQFKKERYISPLGEITVNLLKLINKLVINFSQDQYQKMIQSMENIISTEKESKSQQRITESGYNKNLSRGLNLLSICYQRIGNAKGAIDCLLDALSLELDADDKNKLTEQLTRLLFNHWQEIDNSTYQTALSRLSNKDRDDVEEVCAHQTHHLSNNKSYVFGKSDWLFDAPDDKNFAKRQLKFNLFKMYECEKGDVEKRENVTHSFEHKELFGL